MLLRALDLADEQATGALGAALAPVLRGGDILRLEGDLGAGKSTLARGLIAALTGVPDAPSPTFTLVETYDGPDFALWHFDLYRLEAPEDVWELGLEEALDGGLTLIEWPERIEGLLPDGALTVRLEVAGAARVARLEGDAPWKPRLSAAGIA
ncbi:tRNA (adenosine(37)-N6)-threonylcarbamoyltransferase complex ATPase subunit type 1 TsaE [Marinicaulis aureus]|uniref:tRNA threonylcarbamoyladenosine biosynthesis protein TsaE n=1 Tax=Hyphococcus aureus TaxID=2666033 RepID=A0ABW1KYL3_9PROT